jgi:hypothetical protein
MATTHPPSRDTQITPAQRRQAPIARRANRRWPHPTVIATRAGAKTAFAIAAAILFAAPAAAKSGEYGQVCTGPHNVTAATCQTRALQQVPLGAAIPEGCHRTGPVNTACGRAEPHRHPSGAGGATRAVSSGADSTITSPDSAGEPNSASPHQFSPTHTQVLHSRSHR